MPRAGATVEDVQRLSGTDAGFLYGETASWHMHAGAVIVLDPSTAPRGFDVGRVRELVRRRLPRLGPFRYRLVELPLGIDRPFWVEVPELDLEAHVRSVSLPAGRGMRELGTFTAGVLARKLDRRRPLWEMWFVDGLDDGHVALVVKIHHACIDGIRAARLYDVMFDEDRDAPIDRGIGPAGRDPPPPPSRVALAAATAAGVVRAPMRVARALAAVSLAGMRVARFATAPEHRHVGLPFQAAPGTFHGAITPARSVAFSSMPMELVRSVRETHHATFNDVVLAACTGALRSYLLDHDAAPTRPLLAAVPVGVRRAARTDDGGVTPGNFISAMGALLPVHLDDPVHQLRAIAESTHSAKALHRALGDDFLLDLVDAVPPAVIASVVRTYAALHLDALHPPIFNVLVSTFAGARAPVYMAGAKLVAAYPLGPLLVGSGLNITAVSYDGRVDAGLVACPSLVDDLSTLASGLPSSLGALVGAQTGRRQHAT